MESSSPSLQRTILRLVQTHEPIERSKLGLRSRSYDMDNWEAVLDDLVSRGLITEDSTIRVGENSRRNQKRAVIIYRMGDVDVLDLPFFPKFADMSTEEVLSFVEKYPPVAASVAS